MSQPNSPTKSTGSPHKLFPKQNRCTQHSQQIVALCIDSSCTRATKAVCPLELYNDHLDHQFQNISKVHSEWGLFGRDAEKVSEFISRQSTLKYLDSIVQELLQKVKQHLFLTRKEFQIRLNSYYSSKPVEKIRSALTGLHKCSQQQFLALTHQEIMNAKFFTEVYGMQKLVNDTAAQRQTFERQILVAYAKLKEEMFMDYPKFNALFRAKQYEYCEIIKTQKAEIYILREQIDGLSSNNSAIGEENKQLSYELTRTANELKNKEALLTETTQKLGLMTKKYNEQAEQAILRARQIKTQNIFGIYANKDIYRLSDRKVCTSDKLNDWPLFTDVGFARGKLFVKLNRFDVGSWVLLGIMHRSVVEKNEYEFDNYKALGHGTFMMDNNRWCYSDHDEEFNCRPLGFEFGQGDTIKVEVFERVVRYSKMAFGWQEEKFQLPFVTREGIQPSKDLYFCVAIKGEHTEVQLV